MSLTGRTVLVTGAGQGIGLGVATLAAELGANVVLADMNAAGLETASATFSPDRVLTGAGDVVDPDFVEDLVAQAMSRFGVVDGLVNTAGITRPAMIDKMTLAQWDQILRVHLTGAFLGMQAVGRRLIARRARICGDHQRVVGCKAQGNDRPDQLQRGEGRHPRRHDAACCHWAAHPAFRRLHPALSGA